MRMVNPRNNKTNREQLSNNTGEGTVVVTSTESITFIASTTTILSTAQEGVIFSSSITQSHHVIPRPTMASDFMPYATSFTMHMPSHEQLYGMPTSMMEGL